MTDAVQLLIEPRTRDLGGFNVRRILPYAKHRNVGPFVFFDHLGPATFPPGEGMDVRPHPHIGLATVTWLFEGAIDHRDSLGTIQTIRPGAVNWMTAGRGIVHSERTPPTERAAGHRLEAIQTWVALPRSRQEQAPTFVHHPADTLPRFSLPGGHGVVLAGSAFGHRSPVEFPAGILQVVIEATSEVSFDMPEAQERCLYLVSGAAAIDGQALPEAHMAVVGAGKVGVKLAPGTRVMIAGGDALDGPRVLEWNFVASDKERLAKASADWRASIAAGFRDSWFSQPPGEASYIPLPGDPEGVPMDTPPL
jgi:redox-sensitive bicupin YhaK (pirin superfamily)